MRERYFGLGLSLLIAAATLLANETHADTPAYKIHLPFVTKLHEPFDPRFGVVHSLGGTPALQALRISSYYGYAWGDPLPGAERIQMVGRPYISDEGLNEFISTHRANYWMVGNEPNNPSQDDLSPQEYAKSYFFWYNRIKSLDPQAKLIAGQIVNYPTAGDAIVYLDTFREEYKSNYGSYPKADVWAIHAYPPFEVDSEGKLHSICSTATLKEMVLSSIDYLRSEGETAPIWLTEFGLDWAKDDNPCYPPFMTDMVTWLKTQDIKRWFWYSMNATAYGHGGSLVNLDGQPTSLGLLYRDLSTYGIP